MGYSFATGVESQYRAVAGCLQNDLLAFNAGRAQPFVYELLNLVIDLGHEPRAEILFQLASQVAVANEVEFYDGLHTHGRNVQNILRETFGYWLERCCHFFAISGSDSALM
jgi:hypothetical protein